MVTHTGSTGWDGSLDEQLSNLFTQAVSVLVPRIGLKGGFLDKSA